MEYKKCQKCLQKKLCSEFFLHQRWCKECNQIYQREWKKRKYLEDPKLFRTRVDKWRKDNPEKAKEISRSYLMRLKELVFSHYSKSGCSCCGEKEIKFLTIEHSKNNGAEERKRIFGDSRKGGGSRFYLYLKRNNFPKGYDVLCYNCNCAKGFYKVCPHKLNKKI